MLHCSRETSNKLYNGYILKWQSYCQQTGASVLSPTTAQILDFLQSLREDPNTPRGYSAICTARSALSSIIELPGGSKVSDNIFIKRFIKGVYNLDPPKTRYATIWDPDVVLKMLNKQPWIPLSSISLLMLAQNLIFILLLITGQRGQFITALDIQGMIRTSEGFHFKINNQDIKQGQPGYRLGLVTIKPYEHDRELCPVALLNEYLHRTENLRGSNSKIFITGTKPYTAISRDTVSRWVKTILRAAGVNTAEFAAGSTRAAASSKASQKGVPLQEIMDAAGWSRPTTFQKWYQKEIRSDSNRMANSLLGN